MLHSRLSSALSSFLFLCSLDVDNVSEYYYSLRHSFQYPSALGPKYLEDTVCTGQNVTIPYTKYCTRFILNYKRLPYRTKWIEFVDVESTLRSIGAQPSSVRPDGRPVFSLPVIIDPRQGQGRPIVLSKGDVIAEYLELTYPARSIFPDGSRALQSLFVHYIHEVLTKPLLPILVPLSHQRLPERSQAHFAGGATPLGNTEREQAWRAAKNQFNFLASIMDKNMGDSTCDGIVVMGRTVTYADFALCSVL
jgi:glutathione S-transferase